MITTAKGWEEDLASGEAQEVEVVMGFQAPHGEAVRRAVDMFSQSRGRFTEEAEVFLAQIVYLPRIEAMNYVFYVRDYDNGEEPS